MKPDRSESPLSMASGIDPSLLAARLLDRAGRHTVGERRASVAAVFRPGHDDLELLFIQRATVHGDPWSGQMAFPGGRAEAVDSDSFATAERETLEEVGLDLSPAERLGSLAEVDGGRATNRQIRVSGHCYFLDGDLPLLAPNHEVADTVWVRLADLLDRGRYIDYWYPASQTTHPGIQLDKQEHVVWGLTLRFLADLFARVDKGFIV